MKTSTRNLKSKQKKCNFKTGNHDFENKIGWTFRKAAYLSNVESTQKRSSEKWYKFDDKKNAD